MLPIIRERQSAVGRPKIKIVAAGEDSFENNDIFEPRRQESFEILHAFEFVFMVLKALSFGPFNYGIATQDAVLLLEIAFNVAHDQFDFVRSEMRDCGIPNDVIKGAGRHGIPDIRQYEAYIWGVVFSFCESDRLLIEITSGYGLRYAAVKILSVEAIAAG